MNRQAIEPAAVGHYRRHFRHFRPSSARRRPPRCSRPSDVVAVEGFVRRTFCCSSSSLIAARHCCCPTRAATIYWPKIVAAALVSLSFSFECLNFVRCQYHSAAAAAARRLLGDFGAIQIWAKSSNRRRSFEASSASPIASSTVRWRISSVRPPPPPASVACRHCVRRPKFPQYPHHPDRRSRPMTLGGARSSSLRHFHFRSPGVRCFRPHCWPNLVAAVRRPSRNLCSCH